ncbi:MAG: DUF3180 domain-containing protein [Candidatus Nanopelagicales bacterium]
MKRTSWVWLISIAIAGVGVGWLLVLVVDAAAGRILDVPLTASIALWVLAIGIVLWAMLSRPRLMTSPRDRPNAGDLARVPSDDAASGGLRDPRRMPPLMAARTAALAMAASRTGALVGGFYAGIALALLSNASTPTGSASLVAALVAIGAAASMTIAAVWLESLCRVDRE